MTNVVNGGKSSRFKLLKICPTITSNTLQDEINRRKIPLGLAGQYLVQALVLDRTSQRKYMALAFENVLQAYEITIPFAATGTSIKAAIPVNAHSFIRGQNGDHVQVFRTAWDFLTWLTMNRDTQPRVDTYIMNGNKTINEVCKRISANRQRLSSVIYFLDNDTIGSKLAGDIANTCRSLHIEHGSQNYLYASFKDLSDYWIRQPSASSIWPIDVN